MSYSYDKFLRPITSTDVNIQILDDNGNIIYTVKPFSIVSSLVNNNLLKINLESGRVITINFSTTNEAKLAISRLQEQIDELITKTPQHIDKEVENFIDTKLSNIDGHLLPSIDSTYDIGSHDLQWRSLYVSSNTIYIGGVTLSTTGDSITVQSLNLGTVEHPLILRSQNDKLYVNNLPISGELNFNNGLQITGLTASFGGTLSNSTTLSGGGYDLIFKDIDNLVFTSSVYDVVSDFISLDSTDSIQILAENDLTLNASGVIAIAASGSLISIQDGRGLVYHSDYSGGFVPNSLVSKKYVDDAVNTIIGNNNELSEILENGRDADVNGDINDSSSNTSINLNLRVLKDSTGGIDSINWEERRLYNSDGDMTVDYQSELLNSELGVSSLDWKNRKLYNSIGAEILSYSASSDQGLVYLDDYSSNFETRSLVDKGYVDSGTSSIWSYIEVMSANTSGTSGSSGSSGTDGSSGTSGTSGSSGSSGVSGINGVDGTSGLNGISGGSVYYFNSSLSESSNLKLSVTASNLPESIVFATASGNTTTTIATFETPNGWPGISTIPAGIWSANLHLYKALNVSPISIFLEIYKIDISDVETLLFSTDPVNITTFGPLNLAMYTTDVYQSGFSIDDTDRIIIRVKVTNGSGTSVRVYLYSEGSNHYSYVTTTLGSVSSSGTSGTSGSSGSSGTSGTSGSSGLVAYTLPDTPSTGETWIFLGTWNTAQTGHTLRMELSAHAGYNAGVDQNQTTVLYFATSNGISTNPSAIGGLYYANGAAERNINLGTQSSAPSVFRIVQSNTGTYLFYGSFGQWAGNSHYTISVSGTSSWSHSGITASTPSGTYLDITPSSSGSGSGTSGSSGSSGTSGISSNGPQNFKQVLGSKVTGVNSVGVTLISGTISTTGGPVNITVTGDANSTVGTSFCRLQIYRDSTPIGNIVHAENGVNLNVPYCVNCVDSPASGTYTYSLRTVGSFGGTMEFGEASGPTLVMVELTGSGTSGTSGTSGLTPTTDWTLTGGLTVSGTSSFLGLTVLQEVSEVINTTPGATASVVVYDFSTGTNWYHSSANTNYTANFINVPITNNRAITTSIVINQGATAYIPTVLQINSATQTIKWSGGTASGTANQVDIVGFTFIRDGAGNWAQVLGQINTFD